MRGQKSFIAFNCRPSPLVLERIVKSLTIPPSQCSSNDSNLWPSSDTTYRTTCLTNPSNDQLVSEPGHRFESLESHCEGGIVRDFTIRSNTDGLGLRLNAIKDLCPLVLHQLVVGWIGKVHGPTSGTKANCEIPHTMNYNISESNLELLLHRAKHLGRP